MTEAAWVPAPALVRDANLTRFMQHVGVTGITELHARAEADPAWFWEAVVRDLDWPFPRPWEQVLDLSRGKAWATWFTGATTNLALACVDRWRDADPARPALFWEGEDGAVRRYTYAELADEAERAASGLRALGVDAGSRVGIFLPMLPETVVALYALAKLGAVAVPMFSGYGPEAVATRLRDAGASFLITADGFLRRGRRIPMKEVADQASDLTPEFRRMVVVRRLGGPVPWNADRDVSWDACLAGGREKTRAVDTETPALILYTSGTTGRPKGAVHPHAGFPLKAAQDLSHCFDLKPQDRLFWFTDMAWMMGPWAVYGSMAVGASLVMYEGSPDHPGPDRLWDVVERHRVTVLGLSPTVIRALMGRGEEPVKAHDLRTLRILGSTGEPWNPDPWWWYFRVVGGGRCPIINYSGGTEVSGGIVSTLPILPLRPMAFHGPVPGMAARVLLADGGPAPTGEVGELAVLEPWPGMTRGFVGDSERYVETYWSRFPDVWVHGDWAVVDEAGDWFILGRSDDTIKVAGKRLGPAEAESAAVAVAGVREAAAIGAPHAVKGEVLVLFCIPQDSAVPTADLASQVTAEVERRLGRALRPDAVHIVEDLPRTRNGKIVRRAVRAAYLRGDPGDLSSVDNPDSLRAIEGARSESAP